MGMHGGACSLLWRNGTEIVGHFELPVIVKVIQECWPTYRRSIEKSDGQGEWERISKKRARKAVRTKPR